jgi:NAD(P)-dependent dehydrogenase (short-subunit alcohol dehydrogenase family)
LSASGMPAQRWCLVSGGSGGIGAAVCERLAQRELKPIVGYHRAEASARALAERYDGMALELDLSRAESIESATRRLDDLPWLAGVVLAGSPAPALVPFGKLTLAELQEQWQVNVLGPQQLLAQLIRGRFRKQKAGFVVGVLSRAMGGQDEPATPNMGAYVIAKHGLCGVLAAVRADYPWLRVGSVRPGYTETPMLRAFDERFLELERAKAPFQTPGAVADLILKEAFGT